MLLDIFEHCVEHQRNLPLELFYGFHVSVVDRVHELVDDQEVLVDLF